MICKNCPEARRFAEESMYCLLYGIIIRENHECTREGGKAHDKKAADGSTSAAALPSVSDKERSLTNEL